MTPEEIAKKYPRWILELVLKLNEQEELDTELSKNR